MSVTITSNQAGNKAGGIVDPSGGANQTRVRDHNQRLVLSLVRRHGSLPKSEIAVRSGLTAQTVTVIMRVLEEDGLLLRGEPVRGKVGQPSIPMSLNPEAVFSIGLKIGRRSADLVLVDFVGKPRKLIRETFDYPTTDAVRKFIRAHINTLTNSLPAIKRKRIAGIGISLPNELWQWAEKIGAPQAEMNEWRKFDFVNELATLCDLPVFVQNDATAACGAELVFGKGASYSDFVYFYIGTFIGGGIVLNHSLYSGRNGNAGALGSMPVNHRDGTFSQLIDHASVITLESLLRNNRIDPSPLWLQWDDWSDFGTTMDQWIDNTAIHLAASIVSTCSVIDFEAALIDGAFPIHVRARLVKACRREMQRFKLQGLLLPDIIEGQIGSDARAIGGACLPLIPRYLLDQNVLFKEQKPESA